MEEQLQTTDWMQQIRAQAEEEQRRSRCPEVDADHLLLAMLGLGGAVADALRQQGVTLEGARRACERIRPPHRMAAPPDGNSYRDGICATLERAASQPQPDVALLQLLLLDPTGRVRRALRELHITHETLRLPIPEEQPYEWRIEHQRVIPAAPKAVWGVISDPTRAHEWLSSFFDHCQLDPMGVLITWSDPGTERRGLVTVTKNDSRNEHLLIVEKPLRELRWDSIAPEARRVVFSRLRFSLAPHEQGTDMTQALEIVDFDTTGLPKGFAFRTFVLPAIHWFMRWVVTKQLKAFARDIASAALRGSTSG